MRFRRTGQFVDRSDAGRRLADELARRGYAGRSDLLVLALPRGGVPVAYEVARRLNAPLDVFLVRKLGVPGHEELAMGAIATGGSIVLNPDVLQQANLGRADLERVAEVEWAELLRRERAYRGDRPAPDIAGKTVILIDDGLATGASMRAAVAAAKKQNPARLVVAVPVAAATTCEALAREVDDVVCPLTPSGFTAVGMWYEDFSQTSDAQVRDLLAEAQRERSAHPMNVVAGDAPPGEPVHARPAPPEAGHGFVQPS
jgi:predicted phosphoribosyltransferase